MMLIFFLFFSTNSFAEREESRISVEQLREEISLHLDEQVKVLYWNLQQENIQVELGTLKKIVAKIVSFYFKHDVFGPYSTLIRNNTKVATGHMIAATLIWNVIAPGIVLALTANIPLSAAIVAAPLSGIHTTVVMLARFKLIRHRILEKIGPITFIRMNSFRRKALGLAPDMYLFSHVMDIIDGELKGTKVQVDFVRKQSSKMKAPNPVIELDELKEIARKKEKSKSFVQRSALQSKSSPERFVQVLLLYVLKDPELSQSLTELIEKKLKESKANALVVASARREELLAHRRAHITIDRLLDELGEYEKINGVALIGKFMSRYEGTLHLGQAIDDKRRRLLAIKEEVTINELILLYQMYREHNPDYSIELKEEIYPLRDLAEIIEPLKFEEESNRLLKSYRQKMKDKKNQNERLEVAEKLFKMAIRRSIQDSCKSSMRSLK